MLTSPVYAEIIAGARQRYLEIFEILTDRKLA